MPFHNSIPHVIYQCSIESINSGELKRRILLQAFVSPRKFMFIRTTPFAVPNKWQSAEGAIVRNRIISSGYRNYINSDILACDDSRTAKWETAETWINANSAACPSSARKRSIMQAMPSGRRGRTTGWWGKQSKRRLDEPMNSFCDKVSVGLNQPKLKTDTSLSFFFSTRRWPRIIDALYADEKWNESNRNDGRASARDGRFPLICNSREMLNSIKNLSWRRQSVPEHSKVAVQRPIEPLECLNRQRDWKNNHCMCQCPIIESSSDSKSARRCRCWQLTQKRRLIDLNSECLFPPFCGTEWERKVDIWSITMSFNCVSLRFSLRTLRRGSFA